jgi:FMN reductase [NAD(P)H]
MEFRELLKRRRMVRHYAPDAVDRETLERIVSTVRRAPSAGYSQGQRLLVVSDRSVLDELAALEQGDTPDGVEPWFGTAAAHILVLTREDDYHDRYRKEDKLDDGEEIAWPTPFWFVDAGAALMLILLAAIDEGLAAAVYGVLGSDEPRVRALLKIPPDLSIVAGVTLGRPAPDPEWSKLTSRATQPRRSRDELVRWERWDTQP